MLQRSTKQASPTRTRTARAIGFTIARRLCEQALAIDPNNVRALMVLGTKFLMPPLLGLSGDPKGDLGRADQLE